MRNYSYPIRISFASKRIKTYHSAVDSKLRTGTVLFGSLPVVTLSYLSHSVYFYLYTQIVADSSNVGFHLRINTRWYDPFGG